MQTPFSLGIVIPWKLRDLGKALLVIFLLITGINLLLFVIDFEKIFIASDKKSLITIALFLVQEAFFLLPLIIFIFRKYKITPALLGFRPIGIIKTVLFALRGYAYVIFLSFLIYFASGGRLIPGFGDQPSYFPLFGDIAQPLNLIFALLVIILIAPVVEEIVFRGVILQTFMKYFGMGRGNLCAAVLFAAIHFQFNSFFLLLILGLILNWIFIKSRSLYPTIGFHMLNNTIAFVVQFLIETGRISI